MSVVQVFLGRPRDLLLPSIFPSSCSCDELCLIICPRYCNFIISSCLIISLHVYDIFNTLRYTPSQGYQVWTTVVLQLSMSLLHRIASARQHFIALNLVFRFMPRHDSSVLMLVNVVRAIIVLLFLSPFRISLAQLLSSHDTYMGLLVQSVVHIWQYLFWVNLVSC